VVEPPPSLSGADPATRDILQRLGLEVEILSLPDAQACLARCRAEHIDLVVLDLRLEREAERVLAGLHGEGPPVLVVSHDAREEVALDAFRRGAADCIVVSRDYAQVLPQAVLEQIASARATRERKALEEHFEKIRRFSEVIVEVIPVALLIIDANRRVVGANPEFHRLFHVREYDIVGKLLDAVLPAELLENGGIEELLVHTAQGRSATPRLARILDPAGEPQRVFDVRARPFDDHGGVLLVLADVSERERLSKRVGDLQRYHENIIQNLNSALLVTDRGGRITFANPIAQHILGGAPLLGRRVQEFFPRSSRERHLLLRTLTHGERYRGIETVIARDDASRLPIGISSAPLLDAAGTRVGAVAVFQDLSQIRELQHHALQSEKMASLGQLAAGVAHEINNPMGFIHANLFQMTEYLSDLRRLWERVEVLQTTLAGTEVPAVRDALASLRELSQAVNVEYVLSDFSKALRESQEGSERIRHIVRDLRHFSRGDTEKCELFDVVKCLDSTVNMVATMVKHTVTLEKSYSNLPPLRCYPMQLQQVFMNLLSNAYQAIQERQRESGSAGGKIRIRAEQRDQQVVISVADDGIGIPEECLPRIFDPFFTTKQVGAGMGLGLSISYGIVERHGGSIRVESKRGEGTCFEVLLPLEGLPYPTPEPAA